MKCYKCHQTEHFKRNCPLLKIEKGKSTSKGGLVAITVSKDYGDDLLVVSNGSIFQKTKWTLDSDVSIIIPCIESGLTHISNQSRWCQSWR